MITDIVSFFNGDLHWLLKAKANILKGQLTLFTPIAGELGIERLEFEFAHIEVTIYHLSNYASSNPS